MNKYEKILNKQKKLNNELGKILNQKGIKNLRLTSIGNSIATGYSMATISKPLLLRNETLPDILKNYNILLETHKFSRCQNNCDDHTLTWFLNNTKESEINKLNRLDFSKDSKVHMLTNNMTEEEINLYFPRHLNNDNGMQDIILESNKELANIVIYNGATGSLLDNICRQGSFNHKLNYGIKKDIISIESILKNIQENNRQGNSNTQVYLCGAPNFLGLNITGIINNKLKKLSKEYANVIYVKPIKAKFLYKNNNIDNTSINKIQKLLKKLPIIDIHYDELEYLMFNNNIIQSIVDNYESTEALIKVDKKLSKLSTYIETRQKIINKSNIKKEKVLLAITKEYAKINNKDSRNKFITKAKKYLLNTLPYEYFYVEKENIKQTIKKLENAR